MKAVKPIAVVVPDKLCSVCGRVLWGYWVRLPGDKGRHSECGLGSEAWLGHYQTLSPSEQAPLREFFEFTYPPTGGIHNG